tara:strand:- start:817 stop:1158 length:342 start_codon:yes stop_codon:yes gene_type:complete
MENSPSLCEPGVKYFISGTLKECHKFKERHMSIFFNIGISILFIIFVGGFLVYKYKGKLTPQEIAQKRRHEKEYIISKLQQLSAIKKVQNPNLITNLPTWDNHPEIDRLRRKI